MMIVKQLILLDSLFTFGVTSFLNQEPLTFIPCDIYLLQKLKKYATSLDDLKVCLFGEKLILLFEV